MEEDEPPQIAYVSLGAMVGALAESMLNFSSPLEIVAATGAFTLVNTLFRDPNIKYFDQFKKMLPFNTGIFFGMSGTAYGVRCLERFFS